MINNVTLVGRMTWDAELEHTQSEQAVASFTLAVNRAEGHEIDFINCVILGQAAENLTNWCKRGDLIGLTGRIQISQQRMEVVADNFQILEN
ncbi:single-stranded DNA-binding protein [Streptococcus chenjunshii]|uniref:Single-stranded DNA-binding protein n=1 Tax=Streptococcus chenjunshii TaxID=2173853 RepID=A0A372KNQ3_9STRE|nr:single-stranded DNA-binding protein [Streptococcus chenjunshii]RFU51100.1 single-stranded DNA-binding protein [Streptococcus chenjunshii]RFU53198.1 single-stranded DNA-binding protein [Streptococcus chenjunshii]